MSDRTLSTDLEILLEAAPSPSRKMVDLYRALRQAEHLADQLGAVDHVIELRDMIDDVVREMRGA